MNSVVQMPEIRFVSTNEALAESCLLWRSCAALALDTEFLRCRTFFPKPGLFQVNDGSHITLVDPCAITEWATFRELLENPAVTKVLHSCEEDVELFHCVMGAAPFPVFDTQIAAGLCGHDYPVGYQRLVNNLFGVEVEKDSSRSDWMQRPLADSQILYAAADVLYLLPAYEQLSVELARRGLEHVMAEEYQEILAHIRTPNFDNAYLRCKQLWKLDGRELAILKALATWREQLMRSRDMPRNRIATNEALMELAAARQPHFTWLFSVEGLPAATVKQYGNEMLDLMARAGAGGSFPDPMPKPARRELMDQWQSAVRKIAEREGIAPGLFGGKKLHEEILHRWQQPGFDLADLGSGWRTGFLAEALVQLRQQ